MATRISSSKCHGGLQQVYQHSSKELECEMVFSIFLPSQAKSKKCPVLFFLSGLTCTEKNFIEKSGFQQHAEKHGIIVVGPDTSPRGCNIEGEDEFWYFGTGAGFYIDATEPKWNVNYRMYSYVTKELPELIQEQFPVSDKMAISGHSMGGHGAMICALKNPGMYSSVSAFAPISNPVNCPWGKSTFSKFLGSDLEMWAQYDSTLLAEAYDGPGVMILIDQGEEDIFLKDQLLVQNFVKACEGTVVKPTLRMQEGYDHSYYFVSTFLGDHFEYHAKFLN